MQRRKQRGEQKLSFLDRSGGRYGFHLHTERAEAADQFKSLDKGGGGEGIKMDNATLLF